MSTFAKIIAGMVLIFLIIVGYKFLSSKAPVSTGTTSGLVKEAFDTTSSGENQDFLRALKNLETVSLDPAILSSEAFTSLVDFSVELTEEPKGRINPFRPINLAERDQAAAQARPTSTTTPSQ